MSIDPNPGMVRKLVVASASLRSDGMPEEAWAMIPPFPDESAR